RAKVKWDVVTQSTTSSRSNWACQTTLLDMQMRDIGASHVACDALRVGEEPTCLNDARQVVHMGNVEDLWIRGHRVHADSFGAAFSSDRPEPWDQLAYPIRGKRRHTAVSVFVR